MDRDVWLGPILFGICVLLGMLFIVIAKLAAWPALIVTFVPIFMMCSYAGATFLPSLRLRDDQTGDNLYYMGFLFTLASLAVSLFQFTADGSAEQIVQSFGIAIGSTIAGVALRVFFSQMRRDPIEVERDARLELAEAARRVRNELDATVMEMSNFQRATTQVINDGFNTVQANVDRISQDLVKSIQKTVEETRAPLVEVSRTSADAVVGMGKATATRLDEMAAMIGKRLDESGQKLAFENDRVGASVAKIAEALDGLIAKLLAMQTPDKVIEMKLDPLMKPLIKASSEVTKRTEQAVLSLERQQDRIDRLTQQMLVMSQQIEVAVKFVERGDAAQKEVTGEIRAIGQLLGEALLKREQYFSAAQLRELERGIVAAIKLDKSIEEYMVEPIRSLGETSSLPDKSGG